MLVAWVLGMPRCCQAVAGCQFFHHAAEYTLSRRLLAPGLREVHVMPNVAPLCLLGAGSGGCSQPAACKAGGAAEQPALGLRHCRDRAAG